MARLKPRPTRIRIIETLSRAVRFSFAAPHSPAKAGRYKPAFEAPVRLFDATITNGVGSYNKKPATRGAALPRVVAKFAFYPRRARRPFHSFAGLPTELRGNKWSPHSTRHDDVPTALGCANREQRAVIFVLLGKASCSDVSVISRFWRASLLDAE